MTSSVSSPWDTPQSWSDVLWGMLHRSSHAQRIEDEVLSSKTTGAAMREAVAYLARYNDAQLEGVVKKEIEAVSDPKLYLNSVIAFAFSREDRDRMIDVCLRITSLNTLKKLFDAKEDLVTRAKRECNILSDLERKEGVLATQLRKQRVGILSKVAQHVVTTLKLSFKINLDTPPRTKSEARSEILFAKMTYKTIKKLFSEGLPFVAIFYVSRERNFAMVCGAIAAIGVAWLLYSKFHQLGRPVIIDRHYRNLVTEAKQEKFKPSIGFENELIALKWCLVGEAPFAFLIGPPGCGKTTVVRALACEIASGTCPSLKDYQIFEINAANLTDFSHYDIDEGVQFSELDNLLESIKGFEKTTIVFIDEAHNINRDGESGGEIPLMEVLKTKFAIQGIRAIFATTEDEYKKYISINGAMVDRIFPIHMPSLDNEKTKGILLQKAIDNPGVDVDVEAIDQILSIAQNNEQFKNHANPRKAIQIYNLAYNSILNWSPSQLKDEIERLRQTENALRFTLQKKMRDGQGIDPESNDYKQLTKVQADLETKQNEEKMQTDLYEKIVALKTLEKKYFLRLHEARSLVATNTNDTTEAQRVYLLYTFIILPWIKEELQTRSAAFKEKFGEEIPHTLSKKLLEPLFPKSESSI